MPIVITDKSVIEEFVRQVEEISGENISKCMQCGTCTGTCPMSAEMSLGPRRTMLLSKWGQEEQVSADNTVWICASCQSCLVRCPRGIDVPRVMEAIRQITLRTNTDHIAPFEIDDELIKDLATIAMVSCFRKHTA